MIEYIKGDIMDKLILIDGHSLFFRAYYATAYTGNLMKNKDGLYTNALFAFVNMIDKILEEDYTHILIAFDTSKPTHRHLMYKEYKAGREKMPEEMAVQIPIIHEYLEHKGIKELALEGYEADDIIGTIARLASKEMKVDIYSSDKDLLQLVSDNTTVKLIKKGITNLDIVTPQAFLETYGIDHQNMVDLKGLMGDPSDNIPGIPGVGEKTAVKLIQTYGSLEEVIDHKDEIKGKLGERIQEHYELARLSYELSKIDTDVPIEITVSDTKKQHEKTNDLIEFYRRMDLHSFIKRIEQQTFDLFSEAEAEIESDIVVIKDEVKLSEILKDKLAVHCEFDGTNYHTSPILGFGLSDGKNHYFIEDEVALNSPAFKAYLESEKEKYTFDYKAFKVAMLWRNLDLKGVTYDMLLASYIHSSQISRADFKVIAGEFDYDDVLYDDVVYGRGAKRTIPPLEDLAHHVGLKAKAIFKLKEQILNKLKEADLLSLHELELNVSTALAHMEYTGITIDINELNRQKEEALSQIKTLEEEIIGYAGKPFNVNSPKQLAEVLFDDLELDTGKKTKTKSRSTNVEVLNSLKDKHPIIEPILAYRQIKKLYSTYIEGIEKTIFEDGKVHTIYTQALTATGRLSSLEPNLQNIPIRTAEGREIRKFFLPSEGYVLLGADYSQIELRVLAHMSKAKSLIEDFNEDLDIHSQTAMKVFNTKEVTPLERFKAKAVNFGIIYGMGPWSLAEDINTSVKEAEAFIETYFKVYPEIKTFMDETVSFAQKHGYVKTFMGRRRYIPELSSPIHAVKAFGKRTAMNAPIQGGAADIIKVAMVNLFNYIKTNHLKTKILLQVHDELILEVPNEEVKLMEKELSNIMNNAVSLDVKLKTSSQTGHSWFELD